MTKKSEQLITIKNIAAGMDRLNQMKTEIKAILLFLSPYIHDVCNGVDPERQLVVGGSWDNAREIFCLRGTSQASLTLKALGSENDGFEYELTLHDPIGDEAGYDGEVTLIKGNRFKDVITPEHLGIANTLHCYRLMDSLIRWMMKDLPGNEPGDLIWRLEQFCKAARY